MNPAAPGLFLAFAATVLLIFASISTPTWNMISFLDVGDDGGLKYGLFGNNTSKHTSIGYEFSPSTLGFDDDRINTKAIHDLTMSLILVPISAGLAGLSVIFGLCGTYSRVGTIFMTISSALATVVTLVAFVLEISLFGLARNRFRGMNITANFGNGNWLVVGAVAALLLSAFTSCCGIFGRYRKRRAAAY